MADAHDPDHWLAEHGDALLRYALPRLGDRAAAEDAVQDTLVAALQARDRYAGGSSVRTWLIGILKHKILDEYRRRSRQVALTRDDEDEASATDRLFAADGHWADPVPAWVAPDTAFARGQFWEVLERCLQVLPERLRDVYLRRELFDEAADATCQELDVSPTNLWTLTYRARMRLRDCLQAAGVVDADIEGRAAR